MNNAAVNVGVQIFIGIPVFVFIFHCSGLCCVHRLSLVALAGTTHSLQWPLSLALKARHRLWYQCAWCVGSSQISDQTLSYALAKLILITLSHQRSLGLVFNSLGLD